MLMDHIKNNPQDKIIFISNTSEANINQIVYQIQEKFSNEIAKSKLCERKTVFESFESLKIIELTPNIGICTSYLNHTYKNEQQNEKVKELDTPGLISILFNIQRSQQKKLIIVSEYPEDCKTAEKSGISEDQTFTSISDAFVTPSSSISFTK